MMLNHEDLTQEAFLLLLPAQHLPINLHWLGNAHTPSD